MSELRVTAISGPLNGKTFIVDPVLNIGRHPDSDIVLDDKQVSREHARIQITPQGVVLEDRKSGNGTWIENRKIVQYLLSDGDVFKVGSSEFRFEGHCGPASPNLSPVVRRHAEAAHTKLADTDGGAIESAPSDTLTQTLLGAPAENEQELRRTKDRLAAIYQANQIISEEHDLYKLFARVMDQIFSLVPANNGAIVLKDEQTKELRPVYERRGKGQSEILISSTIVKRAYDGAEAMLVKDASKDERIDPSRSIFEGGISSAICVPLRHRNEKLGVIYLDTRGSTSAFTNSDLELINALAGPASVAIKNAQYVEQLEEDFQTTLRLLANAIELRDHYTVGHTWRVTNFSVAIAAELGWPDEKLKLVEMGGVLHDVGKIAVADAVLRKPDRLTDEEYAQMKIHPQRGADLMKDCRKLEPLIPYCLYHHERYDGRGYPNGLKSEEIPIEGRIVAVADTFDAMTSNRPYRKGLDPEIAVAELEKNKGTQFDPQCVDAFVRAYRAGKISHILQQYHENEKSIVCPFCSTYIPIPEGAELGDVFECSVCHRHSKLAKMNEAYCGELMTERDLLASRSAAETHI